MARRIPRIRILLVIALLWWLLFTGALLPQRAKPGLEGSRAAIVTLATTANRLHQELPLALHSLLQQTVPALEIRLHLPAGDRGLVVRSGVPRPPVHAKSNMAWEDPSTFDPGVPAELRHPSIRVSFVRDKGPATKFLYAIEDLLTSAGAVSGNVTGTGAWDRSLLDMPLVVCDDDHYYADTMLETLLKASLALPDAALGFRGWRVREDLEWGVQQQELALHVVEGHRIAQAYQVGVVTANEGYLVRPRFFLRESTPDDELLPGTKTASYHQGPAPILTPLEDGDAPLEAAFVDDIWMNGQLAARGIPRYVVPTPCQSLDVTLSHTLESVMGAKAMTRAAANSATLFYFKPVWESNIWYKFGGENAPVKVGPATALVRTIRNLQLRLAMALSALSSPKVPSLLWVPSSSSLRAGT